MTVCGQGQKKSARQLSALLSCVLCVLSVVCAVCVVVCCVVLDVVLCVLHGHGKEGLHDVDGMGWNGMDEKG